MARTASIVATIGFAGLLLVFAICLALWAVSSPPTVGSLVRATQNDSVLPLERRMAIASTTTHYVLTGTRLSEMTEYYRSEGEPGWEAVTHLLDVRNAFRRLWIAWIVSAAALVVAGAVVYRRGWWCWLQRSLKVAAVVCIALPTICTIVVVFAFDPLFITLHQIVFPQGNWMFAQDSLLIQTFPETFWIIAMIVLLALVALCGVVMAIAGGRIVSRRTMRL